MYKLSSILVFLGLTIHLFAQSPHGAQFKVNCSDCHTSAGWEIPYDKWDRTGPIFSKTTGWLIGSDTARFSHTKTGFPLTGRHIRVDCRACHVSMVFSDANTDCVSCHTDLHNGTVGKDCARCHTTENWLVDNIPELHHDNGFPLVGAHATATCTDCHKSETGLQFDRIGNDCINCHLTDFAATTNPDHKAAGFSTNCAECHDITRFDWTTDKVNHDFFPLTKGHNITDCAKCHTGGSYSSTPSDCISCHKNDYETTVNPSHPVANFSQNCTECHTTDINWMPAKYSQHDADYFPIYSGKHQGTWNLCQDCHTNPSNYAEFTCTTCHTNPETDNHHNGVNGYSYNSPACLACHSTGSAEDVFDHSKTHFPLTGAHLSAACLDCHASGYAGTPTNCASCHTPDYNQSANPNHTALAIPTDCATCHTTAGWEPATFAIHNNYYPLNGAHTAIANDCVACHNGNYNTTPNTCAGCHTPDYNQTTDPNHVAQQFPTDCATCHSESAWAPSTFDHNSFYPLNGAHAAIANDCAACHNGNYTNTPNTCAGCHIDDYNQTTTPNHAAAQLPTDCATCHSQTAWAPTNFDHNSFYPLTGAHAAIANNCDACHNGNYTNTPNTCAGCHTPDYNQSANPNHVALAIPTDCESCHTTAGWEPATFAIHNNYYPLNGAHAAIANDCAACHNGNYNTTPNTCAGCHTPDYNQTTDPNHVAQQFPTDCATCHSESAWAPSTFDHNSFYPLNGAHAAIANYCVACHNGNYTNTPNTCAGCHIDDYNQTTTPNHAAAQFPTDCATCHSQTAWTPTNFDHNSFYPLTGAHAAIANNCDACHNGNYTNTPNTCAGCHTPDYNQSANPNHTALAIPTDCASCHTTAGWETATFAIHDNYYPLNGAHAAIANDCAACHNGNYNTTPNTCAGCHTPDYNQTTDPNHVAQQFPTDCATCHSETSWIPSTFNHNSFYPLTGAHAAIANDCNICHNGNYMNTPNTCAGCHTPDYNTSANPNHTALAIPTDCESCHTTAGWEPATFAIHNNYYPLNGAHAAIANDCAACHNGNYANTPNTCAGCHIGDYNQTTNPNHAAAQFPTDCAGCHSETAWVPATFDHDGQNFPIYSGKHQGEWDQCLDCHTNPTNFAEFTCTTCHTNPETNNQHNGVNGYVYNSPACLACHPTGDASNAFNHNNTGFPLTGAHLTADCIDCHASGYAGTPTDCASCHTPNYNQSTNPNHVALAIPTDCASCHTTTGWEPATFAIHNNYYPLNGAHAAIANDCAACHNGNYNNTPNTCTGCHIGDYNQTTDPNHVAQQFPTNCATCHSETAWIPSTFDHNSVYPLTGAHAAIANDCNACHNGNYTNTPNTCAGCHTPDYTQSTNPNHVALAIPTDCASCHTTTGWEPATFAIHNNYYPLNGAHAAIANDCAACHNGNYNNTPNTCAGCHIGDYNQTTDPNHVAQQFPTNCAVCHSETAWIPASFDHNSVYPLTGAHAAIANDCNTCHNGNYTNTPNTCAGCHTPDYNQSTNPNHVALAIPTDCASCHTTTGWEPATFAIHNNYYPLNGAHAAIANDCAACHNGNYNNTPNTCTGCHIGDYNQTTDPNHVAQQFPTNCAVCHSETAWIPSTFDHNSVYPLTGAHVAIANDCNICHNGNYTNTPNTCAGCHTPDYNQSTNPNHVALAIPTDCASCHTTTGWEPATFAIHNNYYPLNGAHAAIANDCAACHNGNYNNTPNTCAGCHIGDYNQTTDPNHVAQQFPTNCAVCHSETAWIPANFDHNSFYPLTGAHAAIANDCNVCHNGNYTNTPNTCAGCHTPDYTQSTNPNHVALAIPTDCASCHTTDPGWAPATFAIHNNYYPLNGAHAIIANDCAACHNGNYNNTPNTCVGCHIGDYNQTTDPNHATQQLPTDCASCHSETAWVPSTFDHNSFYPLNGAHAAIANNCNACHNGNYNNTPNTCIGCHQTEYNQTNNPNHTSAGFPTTCQDCHSETAWIPATFDHDDMYFPIYSGSHEDAWDQCIDCHTTPGNFSLFSCTVCHTNPETNNDHQGVSGYSYSSPACYACHPNGTH